MEVPSAAEVGIIHRRRTVWYVPAMARVLLTVATAVSLVLCVATTAAWVRSYWVKDSFNCLDTGAGRGTRRRHLSGVLGPLHRRDP